MDCEKAYDKFYNDNKIDFLNDDELGNMYDEIYNMFEVINTENDSKKDSLKKLYEKVIECMKMVSSKNLGAGYKNGIYINQNLNKDGE